MILNHHGHKPSKKKKISLQSQFFFFFFFSKQEINKFIRLDLRTQSSKTVKLFSLYPNHMSFVLHLHLPIYMLLQLMISINANRGTNLNKMLLPMSLLEEKKKSL
ncbi:hypothetical protein CROQUDRAFT_201551 [Cronartium quercuum f. sp. fusiforme G11]|uniref:Uncharacterized protein n=1 Tax=Cronartium quercuum f. sp. fusiforme G11 TaxID=708437 RepID=A0A9P6NG95_9BASI|nr:hypothetical protein CROQUDRAFT_201551 [Cronartium quercuum f. sp. fusiforme G11]